MMLKFALAALLVSAQPAAACHRFSHWAYPFAQRCAITSRVALYPPKDDRSYYVEITKLPLDPVSDPPLPAVEPVDQRTPDQIADQQEHDAAVAAHHDEINKLMAILRAYEDAKRAAGAR
jgi:hypothetical protein